MIFFRPKSFDLFKHFALRITIDVVVYLMGLGITNTPSLLDVIRTIYKKLDLIVMCQYMYARTCSKFIDDTQNME